jgi:hypothetical protein
MAASKWGWMSRHEEMYSYTYLVDEQLWHYEMDSAKPWKNQHEIVLDF